LKINIIALLKSIFGITRKPDLKNYKHDEKSILEKELNKCKK